MKHLKRITIALFLFVATTGFISAQKMAHIDVQELLTAMPEMKAAQAELQKLGETYKADIESSVTELKNKYNQYSTEAATKSKEENDKRAAELQGYEKNIGDAQNAAQQELQKKQQELMGPITEKAKAAIEKVAAAEGIDYVMDASPGGGLIVAKGKNLLPQVKKELGF